ALELLVPRAEFFPARECGHTNVRSRALLRARFCPLVVFFFLPGVRRVPAIDAAVSGLFDFLLQAGPRFQLQRAAGGDIEIDRLAEGDSVFLKLKLIPELAGSHRLEDDLG